MNASRVSFFDTSSLPTEEMFDAMRNAALGDDVYGTDPTVTALELKAAAVLNLESALFVPSGTMANLIAIMVHTNRGDAVVVDAASHVAVAETGGLATVAGCMPILIDAPRGIITAALLDDALLPEDQHRPRPSLVCVENTHNRAGGTITPPETMAELAAACRELGLKLHLDGARIFNAAVARGRAVSELVVGADSVSFALSKGLSCPAGSLLAGAESFIRQARRVRKVLGGAMRQAGVLAAAGIVALERGLPQLAEDHRLARVLAERLNAVPGLSTDVNTVETNIVLCDVREMGVDAREAAIELARAGIECAPRPPDRLRFVTHRNVSTADVEFLAKALERLGTRVAMNGSAS